MSLLPLPVRTRLIAASKVRKEERLAAVNEALAWARLHYPSYFVETQDNVPVPYFPTVVDIPFFNEMKVSK